MALSEKEKDDKIKLKNGMVGVVVLLIVGAMAPTIIQEFTGVDLDTLCEEVENENGTTTEKCLDEGDIQTTVLEGLGYVSIVVAVIGFGAIIIVAVKY